MPIQNQQRDGQMAIRNGGAAPNYANVEAAGTNPNGLGHGDAGWALIGEAGRYEGGGKEDDYTQAGNLFRTLPVEEQQKQFNNISGPLSQVSEEIQQRQLAHFDQADPAYGAGVRAALKSRMT